jgi:PAS domain S-box-containing protein
MLPAPYPPDETKRRETLLRMGLLDTPAEERFDRITRTAQRLFKVPIALISLVDDGRQWFKSRAGSELTESPRESSFCGHAILSDALLVVPDTSKDARFADNPLVIGEPHLRFYAGQPLHGSGGYRVGTLCLLDQVAREFDEWQVAALRDLGSWAELELNLKAINAANAAAQEKEAHLRAIVDNAGDGIITVDRQGLIKSCNPAGARMFGYLAAQLVDEDFRRLMTAEHHAQTTHFLQNFSDRPVLSRNRINMDITCVRENGSTFSAELVVSEMRRPGEDGFNAIVRDLTERKRVEQLKSEFVSTVSHELRTPLTSIRGSLGLLASGTFGTLQPQGSSLLQIAHQNCERLVRLVNDILDVEKIESGNMRYEMRPQSFLDLIKQAISATQEFATTFNVSLLLAANVKDGHVNVDPDRLIQVIVNLLSNAAKFSPASGTVVVDLSHKEHCMRMVVTDQGPGVPETFRSRIFQKFMQVDGSDSRRKGGTGLGLAISRNIVERHAGTIGFDCDSNGTHFYVDLPLHTDAVVDEIKN